MKLKRDVKYSEEDLKHFTPRSVKIPEEFYELIETREISIDDFLFFGVCDEYAVEFYHNGLFFKLKEEACYYDGEYYDNLIKYDLTNLQGVDYYEPIDEIKI